MASASAVAAVSSGPKAPRSKRTSQSGRAMTISATEAGSVRKSANSVPRLKEARPPSASPARRRRGQGHGAREAPGGQRGAVQPGRGLGHRRRVARQAPAQRRQQGGFHGQLPLGQLLAPQRVQQRVRGLVQRRQPAGGEARAQVGQRKPPQGGRVPRGHQQRQPRLGAGIDEVEQRRLLAHQVGIVQRHAARGRIRQAAQPGAVQPCPAAAMRGDGQQVRLAGARRPGQHQPPVGPARRVLQPAQRGLVGGVGDEVLRPEGGGREDGQGELRHQRGGSRYNGLSR